MVFSPSKGKKKKVSTVQLIREAKITNPNRPTRICRIIVEPVTSSSPTSQDTPIT
jgi:hypothetical protein